MSLRVFAISGSAGEKNRSVTPSSVCQTVPTRGYTIATRRCAATSSAS